ncbi:MAG: D-alanyl-D-alanine carboxypeptidase family protein [Bacilli bacterium]|nr:D-alanyl-D-alanine carboxypeptidase family protein [Bacilli bacterium]
MVRSLNFNDRITKLKKYKLIGRDGKEYISDIPGTLGGNKKLKIYGRLDCPSALRWIKKGYYTQNRVFFESKEIAKEAGYRPCAICMPEEYKKWKEMIDMDYTMLVNKENLLPSDYVPEGLIEIHEPTGSKLDSTYVNRLNIEAFRAFKEMQQAALKEGYEIFVDSSYRPYEYQERVFNSIALEKGIDHAMKFVAPPGGSEHQTGLAVDVIFRRNNEMIEQQLEEDPEIKWLFQNAHRFGFILRYPKGKEEITGFNFEPWHFRFVGKELAEQLHTSNITLEEYYNLKKARHV